MIKNHQENFITVMGIDPGLATTGYGIIRSNGREHEILKAHYLKTSPKVDHFERLHYIFTEINNLMIEYHPKEIAIESQFVSKNVRSAISVAEARTVAILAASMHEIDIFSYAPTEIKESITGYGKADKQQVLEMVQALVPINEKKLMYDTSDAIAIALTRIHEW
ncbi:MAG: crossover junction endodeoxyribonuclease RuvC [Chloroflexi bacterium]|nr:crossover junction endodeoxyribonuclease RuvC [Chloroflexota bacterium]|tara:strand:+ start:11646 stop:12140 length:495 start_codon:yes stop_codon:yes gene_type:complete